MVSVPSISFYVLIVIGINVNHVLTSTVQINIHRSGGEVTQHRYNVGKLHSIYIGRSAVPTPGPTTPPLPKECPTLPPMTTPCPTCPKPICLCPSCPLPKECPTLPPMTSPIPTTTSTTTTTTTPRPTTTSTTPTPTTTPAPTTPPFNRNPGVKIPKEYENKTMGFYKYHKTPSTWGVAKKICNNEGAHLVVIDSVDEANVLVEILKKQAAPFAFIGIHDLFLEGDYITITDEPLFNLEYKQWSGGSEQAPVDSALNCGAFFQGGYLNHVDCNTPGTFICELVTEKMDEVPFCKDLLQLEGVSSV